jgi:chromate transporter
VAPWRSLPPGGAVVLTGGMADALDTRVERGSLGELARLFLKLGFLGFGGPAAHIAMLEEEIVQKRQWMAPETFLDLVGATNLIPGPNSTEMMLHVGLLRAGWAGLLVAGVCFVGPAVLTTAALAWVYVELGEVPAVAPLFAGIKPAVLAVILGALWRLGQKAIKGPALGVIAAGTVALMLLGISEVPALLIGGVVGMAVLRGLRGGAAAVAVLLASLGGGTAQAAGAVAVPYSLQGMALFFLKVGSVLFGSGYVLVAFLQDDLVTRWGWLTDQQLLDAIAMGQFTPGPVLSTAAFIGFLLDGWTGAWVAAFCIFAPSFVFVALLKPLVPKLRGNPWSSAFLDAVNAAAVALMGVVTVELGLAVLVEPVAIGIGLVSALAVLRFKVGAPWIVAFGALAGAAAAALGIGLSP